MRWAEMDGAGLERWMIDNEHTHPGQEPPHIYVDQRGDRPLSTFP